MAQPAYPAESWDEWLADRLTQAPFRRSPFQLLAALTAGLLIGFIVARLTAPQPSKPVPAPLVAGQPTSVAISQITGEVSQGFTQGQDPPGTATVLVRGADLQRLVREINAAPVDPNPNQVRSCLGMVAMPPYYRMRFSYSYGDQVTIAVVDLGCGPAAIWAAGHYADRYGDAAYEDLDGLYRRGLSPSSAANQRP